MDNNEVNYSETVDIANLDKHIKLINSHINMFSDDFKDALANLVECGKVIRKQNNTELNYIVSRISNDSVVMMTVNGNTNNYTPYMGSFSDWDLKCLDDAEHGDIAYYGMYAESIEKLQEILKEDFESGIITMISVNGDTVLR